jgi:lipoprotein-anchoring transpeptidase ErfK/SrfK
MAVYENGRLLRTLPSDTGKTGYSTWGGIMVVMDKEPVIKMTSCSVGITCDPSSPDYYDMPVRWDIHLTTSGTYVHDASWDSNIGVDNTSHGCIHLTAADAKWFYDLIKPGDIVRVLNEPQTVAADNGFGSWNLSWAQWLTGSATSSSSHGTASN